MMERRVLINPEESKAVETAFTHYNSFLNVLGYLTSQNLLSKYEDLFNKKFEEAIQLNIKLEQLKETMNQKYEPEDLKNKNTTYYFDFLSNALVYRYEE